MVAMSRVAGVALFYDTNTARIAIARTAYIDDTATPGNLPSPTFGCSVSGNMVQEVSDRRQFVNPNRPALDFEDGSKAAQTYGLTVPGAHASLYAIHKQPDGDLP